MHLAYFLPVYGMHVLQYMHVCVGVYLIGCLTGSIYTLTIQLWPDLKWKQMQKLPLNPLSSQFASQNYAPQTIILCVYRITVY